MLPIVLMIVNLAMWLLNQSSDFTVFAGYFIFVILAAGICEYIRINIYDK